MKKVIYIAEIDADVDDIITAEYLHKEDYLMEGHLLNCHNYFGPVKA